MKVAANDVELFCRIEGEGDPALVMHGGLGADHTVFVNSPFNKLANQLKLIYYDHRCNGRSACPGIETMSHDNLASDAEAIREAFVSKVAEVRRNLSGYRKKRGKRGDGKN